MGQTISARDVAIAAAKKKKPRPGSGRTRPRYKPEPKDENLSPGGSWKSFTRGWQDKMSVPVPGTKGKGKTGYGHLFYVPPGQKDIIWGEA